MLVCTPSFLDTFHFISYSLFSFLSLYQITPLHLAAESGNIKILNHLVDKGADVNIQEDNGVGIYDHVYKRW